MDERRRPCGEKRATSLATTSTLQIQKFLMVAPMSWRILFPDGLDFDHGAARLLLYAASGVGVVLLVGVVVPSVLGMRPTLLTVRSGLLVMERQPPHELTTGGPSLERLAIRTQQGIVLIDPTTVSHAVLDGALVNVTTESGQYLSDQTLNDLQERLPSETFERVHRRALLNLAHVVRLEPLATGGFLTHTRRGDAIEVSRQAARELRKRLKL